MFGPGDFTGLGVLSIPISQAKALSQSLDNLDTTPSQTMDKIKSYLSILQPPTIFPNLLKAYKEYQRALKKLANR